VVWSGFVTRSGPYRARVDGICIYGMGALEFCSVLELLTGSIFFTFKGVRRGGGAGAKVGGKPGL
jgi:hypothetical protein